MLIFERDRPRAVIVFIHGGGFSIGSSDQPSLSIGLRGLPIHGDVILVTMNYRLGVLGFFSTGDSNSPGNYGLWDALEALKFVKNNIANFGGISDQITLAGESAGGAMSSQIMLSPSGKGR